MTEKRCECGCPGSWHNQFGEMPCGKCECKAFRERKEIPGALTRDLFGQLRRVVRE